MVRIIDARTLIRPATAPVLEINVFPDPQGRTRATIDLCRKSQGRIGPAELAEAFDAAEALLKALSYAERHDIPYVFINDPKRLFPPEQRPVREAGIDG